MIGRTVMVYVPPTFVSSPKPTIPLSPCPAAVGPALTVRHPFPLGLPAGGPALRGMCPLLTLAFYNISFANGPGQMFFAILFRHQCELV